MKYDKHKIEQRSEKDINGNGIDDEVETQLHIKHSDRKYNIAKFIIAELTGLIIYACYREWLDLIPALCGWLIGVGLGYCGINVAQKKVDHDNFGR